MKVIFVHGAHSTPISFNFLAPIASSDSWCDRIDFAYNANDQIDRTSEKLLKLVNQHGPIPIIGHSLGGVLAADVAIRAPELVQKLVTISSPLAGVKAADTLRWITPGTSFFDNVATTAPIVKRIAEAGSVVPSLSIISYKAGLPLIRQENDGVVSRASQEALRGAKLLRFKLNHFEILLEPGVREAIKKFIG